MTNKSFRISVFLLLITTVVIVMVSQRDAPAVIRTNFENIPMQIAGFLAVEDKFSNAVYEELNADKNVYRHYINPDDLRIDLYIGYYGTAKGGRTPHNPYACLPSQGWAILDSGTISHYTNYASGSVSLNYVISKKDNATKYLLHWYQSAKTKVLDSGFKRNIQRFLGKILYNRNDGAYVQVSMTIVKAGEEKIPDELTDFTENILELLPKYWPEEQ